MTTHQRTELALAAQPPFYSNSLEAVYQGIRSAPLPLPPRMRGGGACSAAATGLLRGLLERDPRARLGGILDARIGSQGRRLGAAARIRSHQFFGATAAGEPAIDWERVLRMEESTGFHPTIDERAAGSAPDVTNFEKEVRAALPSLQH